MTPFKIIFVHGYTASSQTDWYPAIKQKLDALHVDYTIPELPGGRYPKSAEWLSIIHSEVKKTHKPVVLVGHSLGTRAVLLYLHQYLTHVKYVFLIAALGNTPENAQRRGGDKYPDFFENILDLQKIKPLSEHWLILHSKDDSSVEYETQGRALSREMHIPIQTYTDRDHFCEPENAAIIFDVLRRELQF